MMAYAIATVPNTVDNPFYRHNDTLSYTGEPHEKERHQCRCALSFSFSQGTFDGKNPACGVDCRNRYKKPTRPHAIGTRTRS